MLTFHFLEYNVLIVFVMICSTIQHHWTSFSFCVCCFFFKNRNRKKKHEIVEIIAKVKQKSFPTAFIFFFLALKGGYTIYINLLMRTFPAKCCKSCTQNCKNNCCSYCNCCSKWRDWNVHHISY